MGWQRAASLSEIEEGGVIGVDVGSVPIALYKLVGEVHATDGICTHALALLADGFVGQRQSCVFCRARAGRTNTEHRAARTCKT
jgi:anthranilate 1,2-dioxygenase large subunit